MERESGIEDFVYVRTRSLASVCQETATVMMDRTGRSVAHVSAMPVFYTNFSGLIDV